MPAVAMENCNCGSRNGSFLALGNVLRKHLSGTGLTGTGVFLKI